MYKTHLSTLKSAQYLLNGAIFATEIQTQCKDSAHLHHRHVWTPRCHLELGIPLWGRLFHSRKSGMTCLQETYTTFQRWSQRRYVVSVYDRNVYSIWCIKCTKANRNACLARAAVQRGAIVRWKSADFINIRVGHCLHSACYSLQQKWMHRLKINWRSEFCSFFCHNKEDTCFGDIFVPYHGEYNVGEQYEWNILRCFASRSGLLGSYCNFMERCIFTKFSCVITSPQRSQFLENPLCSCPSSTPPLARSKSFKL